MTTSRNTAEFGQDVPAHGPSEPAHSEESLGEQLLRESRVGQDEFLAGWSKFVDELGIQGKPIGAKKLRELLLQEGINPNTNEFSRGIIEMRGE
ncbi:MAG TPA: hypothetical protein VGP68_19800 [Gemmataceae bacterium]|jgi:hypothetical protein|nr:hypothetical protein [Gemmataceae bacterium]